MIKANSEPKGTRSLTATIAKLSLTGLASLALVVAFSGFAQAAKSSGKNVAGIPISRITISDVTANEGNSGKTPFVFTVSVSPTSTTVITVDFTTVDGTATLANNDYQFTSGTLTFPPGTASQAVTVSVNGDATNEGNEAFTVQLSN